MASIRILVTGSAGLLGYAIREVSKDYEYQFTFVSSRDADLEDPEAARQLIVGHKPDLIIHAAARVGGIRLNLDKPEEILRINRAINDNVLLAASDLGIPKTISFLSTCIFPAAARQPWNEEILHTGDPDKRHWGYATAKRALDLQSQMLSERPGSGRFVTLMPTTMYGPNDNFHPTDSHVLPAVILKTRRAVDEGHKLSLWGTGKPRREFLLSLDMARVTLWAVENYDELETMIVSPSADVSIGELAQLTADIMGYQRGIEWDDGKPDGTPARRTDNSKFQSKLPFFEFTPFADGLAGTIEHFTRHYPNLRGLKAL
jgi:GDP-L-fucose synthase